jgi:predicted small lipoprotein YifL
MKALLLPLTLLVAVLALSACDRKGGAPPKPVTSSLSTPMSSGHG